MREGVAVCVWSETDPAHGDYVKRSEYSLFPSEADVLSVNLTT